MFKSGLVVRTRFLIPVLGCMILTFEASAAEQCRDSKVMDLVKLSIEEEHSFLKSARASYLAASKEIKESRQEEVNTASSLALYEIFEKAAYSFKLPSRQYSVDMMPSSMVNSPSYSGNMSKLQNTLNSTKAGQAQTAIDSINTRNAVEFSKSPKFFLAMVESADNMKRKASFFPSALDRGNAFRWFALTLKKYRLKAVQDCVKSQSGLLPISWESVSTARGESGSSSKAD